MEKIEELLEKEYWVMDFLPRQVKKNEAGQFFVVEDYFRKKEQLGKIQERFLHILLKLNCYYDVSVLLKDQWVRNPDPKTLERMTGEGGWLVLLQDALLEYDREDTHMTVYHPDEGLLDLLKMLAVGEGVYLWKPKQ